MGPAAVVLALTVPACDNGGSTGDPAPASGSSDTAPGPPGTARSDPGTADVGPSAPAAPLPPQVEPARRVVRVHLRRLPAGPSPRVDIIDGTTVVRPDGSRVQLARPFPNTPCCDQPGLSYFGFAPYASGWLTLTSSDTPEVYRHGFDGSVRHSVLSSQLAGASLDGRWALVGGPRAYGPGGAVLRWPGRGDGTAAGFVGQRRVLFDGRRGVYVGRPDASVRPVHGWRHALAATRRGPLAVGQARGGHLGVFSVPSGREVLDVDRLEAPFSFDPSGRWLVGSDARCFCGLVVTGARTGRTILAMRGVDLDDRVPPFWEDTRHLLVPSGRHVLRIAVDGSVEIAYVSGAPVELARLVVPWPAS